MFSNSESNQQSVGWGGSHPKQTALEAGTGDTSGANQDGQVDTTKNYDPPSPICTDSEWSALKVVISGTREFLRRTNQTFNDAVWMEIAEQMYACGWPKRSWKSMKFKGERFLSARTAGHRPYRSYQAREKAPKLGKMNDVPYPNSSSSSRAVTPNCTTHGTEEMVSGPTSDIVVIDNDSVRIQGTWVRPPPPVPSSKSSTCQLNSHRYNDGTSQMSASHATSTNSTWPQILHVCSKPAPLMANQLHPNALSIFAASSNTSTHGFVSQSINSSSQDLVDLSLTDDESQIRRSDIHERFFCPSNASSRISTPNSAWRFSYGTVFRTTQDIMLPRAALAWDRLQRGPAGRDLTSTADSGKE
ncbi:unnamed protein product [Calicophoron daubneyi]|uniref:Myb/SANT-like domain-containing protein n=1 Tax=Calicophoron daubneyi TaxID=300641 RepID=A0AAV2TLW8_CALDB